MRASSFDRLRTNGGGRLRASSFDRLRTNGGDAHAASSFDRLRTNGGDAREASSFDRLRTNGGDAREASSFDRLRTNGCAWACGIVRRHRWGAGPGFVFKIVKMLVLRNRGFVAYRMRQGPGFELTLGVGRYAERRDGGYPRTAVR